MSKRIRISAAISVLVFAGVAFFLFVAAKPAVSVEFIRYKDDGRIAVFKFINNTKDTAGYNWTTDHPQWRLKDASTTFVNVKGREESEVELVNTNSLSLGATNLVIMYSIEPRGLLRFRIWLYNIFAKQKVFSIGARPTLTVALPPVPGAKNGNQQR